MLSPIIQRFGRWKKGLSLSRTISLSDDIQDLAATCDPPTLCQLYGEAAEFEKILAKYGCIDCRQSHKDGSNGFADLVCHDLSQCEQAVAAQVNKLSVARPSAEDVSYSANVDEKDLEGDAEFVPPSPIINRVETDEPAPWKLEPAKIIDLLVDEFGPLTVEGEEEKLLLETDGCLIQDVFIVVYADEEFQGVIHVTTHRIAFHASLFESKPGMPLVKRIIKKGRAVLHKKGWHAKRRVWMELSRDMLCAYTSSSDEGRIRPMSTVLFSFIKRVLPLDPQHPRFLHLEFNVRSGNLFDTFEFDTEESARDWRRELTGALFLYRHQRRAALDTSTTDEDSGIRLSLPLTRIAKIRFGCYPEFPFIASLHVQSLPSEGTDDDDAVMEQETIHIGTIKRTPAWDNLESRVSTAMRRLLRRPLDHFPVFIDFGPLTFHESEAMPNDSEMPWLKEVAIRGALSLGPEEKNIWIIRARIYRNISSSGYFVLSSHLLCFWSKSSTPKDVKYRIPLADVQTIKPWDISICLLHGLTITIKDKSSLKLVFKNSEARGDAQDRAAAVFSRARYPPILTTTPTLSRVPSMSDTSASILPTPPRTASPTSLELESPTSFESPTLFTSPASSPISTTEVSSRSSGSAVRAPKRSATSVIAPLSRSLKAAKAVGLPTAVQLRLPKAINLPREILTNMPSKHFVCLTIGSRGDVQPYIALGLGLKKEGHRVTIVTHEEYKEWIVGFGIAHRTAGGDPGALMKLSVENKACRDADVLLESPSAMAGVHIAEALSGSDLHSVISKITEGL
ncbi:hypothetical protein C0991_006376 [Blastosporella zonata]|nr:hypothetical protein C0991_006376 [Blastosporella zonata]